MLKRSTVFLLTLLVIASVFVPVTFAQDKTVVTVLNYMDLTAPGTQRQLDEIWYQFSLDNPDIIVQREDLFLDAFHNKVEAYAAADKLPDVMFMWPGGRSTTLHTNGLVKDLEPLLGDFLDDYQAYVRAPQAGGFVAMIPSTITLSHAFYANVTLLESLGLSVPETYEELVAMVPTIKAAGLDVVLMGAQDDWVIQSCLFSMIVGRLTGDEKLEEILAGNAKFTDPEFVKSLEFYAKLYDDGVLSSKIMNTGYGEVKSLFAAGRAPFLIDGDWATGDFISDEEGNALFSPSEQKGIKMTIFPAIPGEINEKTSSGVPGVGYGMSSKIEAGSAKEEAALRLIKWLSGKEFQSLELETVGTPPSRTDIDLTQFPLEPLIIERIENFSASVLGSTYVLDDIFEADVFMPINIGLQEIGLGLSTPADVAKATQNAYDSWVK